METIIQVYAIQLTIAWVLCWHAMYLHPDVSMLNARRYGSYLTIIFGIMMIPLFNFVMLSQLYIDALRQRKRSKQLAKSIADAKLLPLDLLPGSPACTHAEIARIWREHTGAPRFTREDQKMIEALLRMRDIQWLVHNKK